MSTYNRLKSRGFTLIELMIVVAIVGVLAALAVYGVRKYLLNSKTAEARNSIGQMAKDASTAFTKDSMPGAVLAEGTSAAVSNQLCASAPAIPAAMAAVAAKKYQSTVAEWNAGGATNPPTGFACLRFSMTDPQYYQYSYTAVAGTSFSAVAQGDLNGDGVVFSSFTLNGAIQNNTVHVAPNIIEVNAEE